MRFLISMISPFKIVDKRLLLREFSVGYEMWIGLAFVFVDPIIVHDANMLKMKREEKYKVMD